MYIILSIKRTNFLNLGYRLDDQGFKSQQGLGIFLFTAASREALGSTQPPTEWVPGSGSLSLGVKRPEREADNSHPSSYEVTNVWSYTCTPPICLHGVVLS
jgi:hypothetical protein